MTEHDTNRFSPEDAVRPFLISIDEDVLTDEEHTLLELDRKFAEKRGKSSSAAGPGSGMGEYITEVAELADGRVQVFTELKVIRETVRRFTLRPAPSGWVLERCEEPCSICNGSGKCHICSSHDNPGSCHCCEGKGYHWRRQFLIIPYRQECSFCEGTGDCISCDDGTCRSCAGKGWLKSPSYNPSR